MNLVVISSALTASDETDFVRDLSEGFSVQVLPGRAAYDLAGPFLTLMLVSEPYLSGLSVGVAANALFAALQRIFHREGHHDSDRVRLVVEDPQRRVELTFTAGSDETLLAAITSLPQLVGRDESTYEFDTLTGIWRARHIRDAVPPTIDEH